MATKKVLTDYKIETQSCRLSDPDLHALVKHLLPADKEKVSFTLTAETCIANAFRRVMIEEIPVRVMVVDLKNVKTSEEYPSDWLATRLTQIPIKQVEFVASLCKRNTTGEIMEIMSGDIEFVVDGRKTPAAEIVDVTYPVLQLSPDKTVEIKNIRTEVQLGYGQGCGSCVGNLVYRQMRDRPTHLVLDTPTSAKLPEFKQSPTLIPHAISFNTVGTLRGAEIIPTVCDILADRLVKIRDFLADKNRVDNVNISLTTESHLSEVPIFRLKIHDESFTIGEMLSRYTYLQDTGIPYVGSSITHPTERVCLLTWKHPAGPDIVVKAINQILAILAEVKTGASGSVGKK